MLKKSSRFVGMFLAVIMLIVAFIPASVEAYDDVSLENLEKIEKQILSPSENALYSVTGKKVTGQVEAILKAYEVNVKDKTLIEVLPADAGNGANVLVVTNLENNLVSKEMLINLAETGELKPMVEMNEDCASPMDGGTVGYDDANHSIVLKATGVYNTYYAQGVVPYVRPIGSYFMLYDKKGNSVSYVQTIYTCGGYTFSYPAFKDLNTFESWKITVSRDNPSVNTMYSQTKEYASNKVIYVAGGHISAGQNMTFYVTVNGTMHWYEQSF